MVYLPAIADSATAADFSLARCFLFDPTFSGVRSAASKVRVFVSYDCDHDQDLYDSMVEQASQGTSGFEISARSGTRAASDLWDESVRRAMQQADEVIVLCGEHSHDCGRMGAELRIAQEEERPYLLVWGRRELMCTKPATARPADAMYSWTREIIQYQIFSMLRAAQSKEHLAELSRARAGAKVSLKPR